MEIVAPECFDRVTRLDNERKPKLIMEARPGRKTGSGRPRLDLVEYVERLVARNGKTLSEVKRLLHERTEFIKWLRVLNV